MLMMIKKVDDFTISDIQVRATGAPLSGTITKNGGTATISGLGDGTSVSNTISSSITAVLTGGMR